MKRYVDCSFWEDEWIAEELSFVEKGFYLYLLTNPLTNVAGVYKLSMRRIVFDTGLKEDEINAMFRKFEDAGKAYRYEKYVILPKWCKHQKVENKNIRTGIENVLKELDSGLIAFMQKVGFCYDLSKFLQSASPEADCKNDFAKQSKAFTKQVVPVTKQPVADMYLKMWRETKDENGCCIFPVSATIEKPKEWARFWQETDITEEQIERAFRNFKDGIISGAIERRYIPSKPDRWLLGGGITRYLTSVKGKKALTTDDDLSQYDNIDLSI